MKIISLTDKTFKKFIQNSSQLILVDFWADWCHPCKLFFPVLDKIAKEFEKCVIFAKINVENNQNITQKYHIKGIPSLLIFMTGKVVDRQVGSISENKLRMFIKKNLSIK